MDRPYQTSFHATEQTQKQLDEISKHHRRSKNSMIEILIENEWKRLFWKTPDETIQASGIPVVE